MSSSTTTRVATRRALVVLLLAGLVLTAAGPGAVAAKRSLSLSMTSSATEVMAGDQVRITGAATSPARTVVQLQRRVGTGWRTVYTTRTTTSKRYVFAFDPPATTTTYRAYVPATRAYRATSSRSAAVRAWPCLTSAPPTDQAAVWFSRPGEASPSVAARRISQAICSAATGATVNVAMYFVRHDPGQHDSNLILDSLRAMALFRGVKVRFVLEGRLLRTGMPLRSTLSRLQTFAKVVVCNNGCHNVGASPEAGGVPSINHHKFVTISDMRWSSGVDPLVLSSTANWSRAQLSGAWQSTIARWKDPVLAREFNAQFEQLWTCGYASPWCSTWDAARAGRYADARYGLTREEDLFFERTQEHPGAPGSGITVAFTPQRTSDRLALALERYTCAAGHRTVRMAHMFATPVRSRVLDALAGLRDRGCDVQVVMAPPIGQGQEDAIHLMQGAGLPVRCATGVHEKLVLLDAVDSQGRPDRVLWSGSQSLGGYALRRNDEALLRVGSVGASGVWARSNATIWTGYSRYWSQMNAAAGTCRMVSTQASNNARVVGPATAELADVAVPEGATPTTPPQ